jgi:hypothetical protein
MIKQKKQNGSTLVVVVLILGLVAASAVRIGYAMQAEKKIMIQNVTSAKAKQLLVGVNEYYIAECYAGGGLYEQPDGIQQLIESNYLARGNYRNTIGEDFTVSIRKDGDVAIMSVEAVFNDASDAMAIIKKANPSISVEYFPVDKRIRWEMTNQMNSGLADLLRHQGGVSIC